MQRLLSIDVLRGLTICLMILVNNPGSWSHVYAPLLHAEWDGCTLTDLVFPFFMFVVGISMFYSTEHTTAKGQSWIQKSLWRGLKLILIGLALNWYPFYTKHFDDLRFFGILQRIGLAYIVASILLWLTKRAYVWALALLVTVGYWIIMMTSGGGDLSLEGNIIGKIDLLLFGNTHIYKGFGIPFDPEGLLSTLPSVGNIILGYFMAQFIAKRELNEKSLLRLVMVGLGCIVIGWIWGTYGGFPINKPLWSSSYVFYTVGIGTVLWAGLIYYIDIEKITWGTYFFKVFGQNAIIAFVLSGVIYKTLNLIKIDGNGLLSFVYSKGFQSWFGDYNGSFLYAISFVWMIWLICYQLDKRGIYVKV